MLDEALTILVAAWSGETSRRERGGRREHEVLDAAEIAARFPTTWQRSVPADHPALGRARYRPGAHGPADLSQQYRWPIAMPNIRLEAGLRCRAGRRIGQTKDRRSPSHRTTIDEQPGHGPLARILSAELGRCQVGQFVGSSSRDSGPCSTNGRRSPSRSLHHCSAMKTVGTLDLPANAAVAWRVSNSGRMSRLNRSARPRVGGSRHG